MIYDFIYLIDDEDNINFYHEIVLMEIYPHISIKKFNYAEDVEKAFDLDCQKLMSGGRILMLLDYKLPGWNGLEFLEEVIEENDNNELVDVVIVSLDNTKRLREKSKLFENVISVEYKPIDKVRLIQIVSET